jgi:hypothetical protein
LPAAKQRAEVRPRQAQIKNQEVDRLALRDLADLLAAFEGRDADVVIAALD